jgi:hypothetical protein
MTRLSFLDDLAAYCQNSQPLDDKMSPVRQSSALPRGTHSVRGEPGPFPNKTVRTGTSVT